MLTAALVHRDSPRCIDRMCGLFAYPVPEFSWQHMPVDRGFFIQRERVAADFIFYEDGKLSGQFLGAGPPIVYDVIDSTLSSDHYQERFEQARQAQLVVVDFDRLAKFREACDKVRRLSYCVNDRLFYDRQIDRDVDVAYHCWYKESPEREALHWVLYEMCAKHGWTYAHGIRNGEDYAAAFSRAKVVVHLSRNDKTRAHRVFDVMGSRAALLASPQPRVSEEEREAGKHYLEYADASELEEKLALLLAGQWRQYADAGYELVRKHHTWSIRAQQLRQMLGEELGL